MTTELAIGQGFIEQFQDYIAANSGLGYTVGENCFVGQFPDPFEEFPSILATNRKLLTLYESTGTLLRSARRTRGEMTVRFVTRGKSPQEANNAGWTLWAWLEEPGQRNIQLTNFTVWNARTVVPPNTIVRGDDGTSLSEFLVSFIVVRKV